MEHGLVTKMGGFRCVELYGLHGVFVVLIVFFFYKKAYFIHQMNNVNT